MQKEADFLEIYDRLRQSDGLLPENQMAMSETPEFKAFHSEMNDLLAKVRTEHLLSKKVYLKSLESNPKQFKKSRILYLLGALVLVIFAFLLLRQSPKAELYEQYFETYPMVALTRSAGSASAVEQGYLLYSQGDYQASIKALYGFSDSYSLFYRGLAQMNLLQFESALADFNQIDDSNKLDFPFHYYKGLCLLQLYRYDEAKTSFTQVNSKFEYYHRISHQLTSKLNR